MYWGIFSRYEIERYKPVGKNAILIRCLEPSEIKKEESEKNDEIKANYKSVLELYFNDIIKEEYRNNESFSKDMTMKLIKFIKLNEFDEIDIHCTAGVSRSATLMYSIATILKQEDIRKEILESKRYNITDWVYREILNVSEKPIQVKMKNKTIKNTKNINVNPKEYIEDIIESDGNTYVLKLKF